MTHRQKERQARFLWLVKVSGTILGISYILPYLMN